MRIRSSECALRNTFRCRDDLLELLRQPTDEQVRPCRGCDEICPCPHRSRICCCRCSARCPSAGKNLSNDGERYPIEPQVLPIVYALSALRVVEPCWSCEGHMNLPGEPKKPQAWFYSGSVTYPELMQRHIGRLADAGKLSTRWEIALCPHQPEAAVALFVMRPGHCPDFHLGRLQGDLRQIAAGLVGGLRKLAREQLLCFATSGHSA